MIRIRLERVLSSVLYCAMLLVDEMKCGITKYLCAAGKNVVWMVMGSVMSENKVLCNSVEEYLCRRDANKSWRVSIQDFIISDLLQVVIQFN